MSDDFRPSIRGQVWPNASASRRVRAANLWWHIQQLGSGPPMLLIHGTGASSHSWEGLTLELGDEFSLTIVDLPGHGFTEPVQRAAMTLPNVARLVGELLQVIGVQPRIIVGHSAGAAIAVRMTLDRHVAHPETIVSLNGALLPWRGMAGWLFPSMARALAASGVVTPLLARRAAHPGAVERMLAGTGPLPPARSIAFYKLMMERPAQVQAALDMMAMWDLESLRRDLPRLDSDLVLVACGEDTAVQPDAAFAVKDALRHAHVRYVRGLGHLAHEEAPAQIADLVRAACRVATPPSTSRARVCSGEAP